MKSTVLHRRLSRLYWKPCRSVAVQLGAKIIRYRGPLWFSPSKTHLSRRVPFHYQKLSWTAFDSTLVQYPEQDAEKRILEAHAGSELIGEVLDESATKVKELTPEKFAVSMNVTKRVQISSELLDMIAGLTRSTRPSDEEYLNEFKPLIWYGAGPRAGISLISVSRAFALLNGEESVRWAHIKRMKPVLRHRIRLTAQAHRDQIVERWLIDQITERLEQSII